MADLLEQLKAALAGRNTIEHEIGRSGMATVYLAEDLKHRRKVAIKVLRPELSASLYACRCGYVRRTPFAVPCWEKCIDTMSVYRE